MMHTKEPWVVSPLLTHIYESQDEDSGPICRFFDANGNDFDNSDNNARRIVACVNACAGIPTETLDLVPNFELAGITTIREIEKKRDELLAALQGYVKNDEQSAFEDWLHITCPSGDVESVQRKWEESSLYSDFLAHTEKARAAIAKAESAK